MNKKEFIKIAIKLDDLNNIQLKEVSKFCIEKMYNNLVEFEE